MLDSYHVLQFHVHQVPEDSFTAGITFFIRLAPEKLCFEDHKNDMLHTGMLNKRVSEIFPSKNHFYFNRNADFLRSRVGYI
jgi:hypothetical protein